MGGVIVHVISSESQSRFCVRVRVDNDTSGLQKGKEYWVSQRALSLYFKKDEVVFAKDLSGNWFVAKIECSTAGGFKCHWINDNADYKHVAGKSLTMCSENLIKRSAQSVLQFRSQ